MSPAPETVRRPPNSSLSPSLPISTILSRALRVPNEFPATGGAGPFTADRRATSSIRRRFSGGPRPAPFQRQIVTLNERSNSGEWDQHGATSPPAYLLPALHTRRRRSEELRSGQSEIAATIAEQWRRQREAFSSLPYGFTLGSISPDPDARPITPPQRNSSPPTRLFIGDESSDSESDDDEDDSDNKFAAPVNDALHTPSPTFITPNTSPSTTASPSNKQSQDESARNAYTLSCRFCANVLTQRGMRARLVADARVHIWSTDEQPEYYPATI